MVKLLKAEREAGAFRAALLHWPVVVSSDLLLVEVMRVAHRLQPPAVTQAQQILGTIRLIPISEDVRNFAAGLGPPDLRTLDAIHLATAELLRGRLGVIFAYDSRLIGAALLRRLPTSSPV